MESKIYFSPVVESKGSCFIVNGATSTDKDEAIRLTKKHVAFKDEETKIIRIDKIKT